MAAGDRSGDAKPPASSGEVAQAMAMKEQLTKILEAVQAGSLDEFRTACGTNMEANDLAKFKDANGRGILHHAAQTGHLHLVQHFVEALGCGVDDQDEEGETALSLAAGAGEASIVAYLIQWKAGVSLRLASRQGPAPIHRAASSGSPEVVEALVGAGADVHMASSTGPPLCWAAGAGAAGCLGSLLKHGADPNSADPNGTPALVLAAACGSAECLEQLLAKGAEANKKIRGGASALHVAAASLPEERSAAALRALLNGGADANQADDDGCTPLLAAAAENCRNAVEVLLPVTTKIPGVEWSVDGVIKHAQEKFGIVAPPSGSGSEPVIEIPEAPEPDSKLATTLKRQGDEAFVKAQYEAAAELYSKALRHDTRNHLVWANRSAAYLRLGKPQEALHDARIARTLCPTYTKAWFREGSAASELQLWEAAALALFEACRLEPNSDDVTKAFQNAIAMGRQQHQAQASQGKGRQ